MPTDAVGDDAPDFAAWIVDRYVREGWVFCGEDPRAILLLQALDRQLAVKNRDNDVRGLRRDAAIDNQKVAIEDAGVFHGLACSPGKKRGGRVPDEVLVQIELALDVIVGRTGEAGGNTGAVDHERQG